MAADLGQVETFVRVVDAGGFRAAAGPLGLTASAVSKRIQALEERLGVGLLQRTTRKVTPTEAGRAYYERAREILADLDEAESALTSEQQEPRGTLRIAAPMDFGRRYLAEPLADYAVAHPGLRLDVDLSDRMIDVVGEGFDLAIRIGALPDSSLIARRLAPCRRLLVASPAYLAVRGTPASLADLGDHDFIGYAFETSSRWRGSGARPLRVTHRTNNGELECAFAIAGMGIALLPTFLVCTALRAGRLRAVLSDHIEADIAVQAVYSHRRHLSAKVRLLVEALAGRFGEDPPWERDLPV